MRRHATGCAISHRLGGGAIFAPFSIPAGGTKLVWNNVTNKATCERNFGKDALLLAINEELKQNCLTGEKANSSDEEKDEEDVVGEKRGTEIDTEPSTSKKKKH